jgi:phosphatidylinositol alpha-1,6-mannosyltransferase
LEFVQQVMPGLIRDIPGIVLMVVGGDATQSLVHGERLRDRIAQAVTEQGLENHVWLAGSLPDRDLNRLFFRSAMFVMPCLDLPGDVEGFGIVYLEAALAGSPCVATRVGGIPDAVVDGETGLLAEPGDYKGIAESIVGLWRDPERRRRLAAAGAKRARDEFSWEAVTRRYEAAFERCVPRR